jgi:hypothetical protein
MASEWDTLLVSSDPIKNITVEGIPVGYEFYIHGVNYRGNYLSGYEELKVRVDGKELTEADSVFALNGKQFLFSQLPELYKEYWMSNKKAAIQVFNQKGLEKDSSHIIEVDIVSRMPFGLDREHAKLMMERVHGKKTLKVE